MPYSSSLGLLFIAVPKTGSSSMTHALKEIAPSSEGLSLLKEQIDKDYCKRYQLQKAHGKVPGRGKHLSALQARYILGEEEFDRCIKFSLVRNPWARMVSRYFFTHVESEPSPLEKARRGTTWKFHALTFPEWVNKQWMAHKLGKNRSSQLAKLTGHEGELLVDHVGRLEKVQETLDWVTERLNVDAIQMPHINGTRKGHYAQFYNHRTRTMVAEICREDIERFDYHFED